MKSLGVFSIICAFLAVALYLTSFGLAFLPILSIFAFGTMWFWILIVWVNVMMFTLIDFVEIDDSHISGATATFLLTGVVLYLMNGASLMSYFTTNLPLLIAFIGTYIVVGCIYSYWKWGRFVLKRRETRDKLLRQFCTNEHISSEKPIPGELLYDWQKFLKDNENESIYRNSKRSKSPSKPLAKEHKGKIVAWACYWPWSFLWTLLNDPVKRLFLTIFKYFQEAFQRVADRHFRGTEDDTREIPDEFISEATRRRRS